MKILLALVMVLSFGTNASPLGGGSTSRGNSSQGGGSSSDYELDDSSASQSGGSTNCSTQENDDDGYVLSYRFLKTIVDDTIPEDERIRIVKNRKRDHFNIEMNRFVSACTELRYEIVTPEVASGKSSPNNFLTIRNKYKFNNDPRLKQWLSEHEVYHKYVDIHGEYTDEWKNQVGHDKKYELCMRQRGLITSDNKIDFKKASLSKKNYTRKKNFDSFKIDKGDKNESVNLYFASGVETDYFSDKDHVVDEVNPSPNNQCRSYEHMAGNKPYRLWESKKDKIVAKYKDACRKGDVQAMLKAQSELRNQNAGNFRGLLAVMNGVTEKMRDSRADEIYANLDEINKELGQKDLSTEEVKDLVEDYTSNVNELREVVLNPAKAEIESLILRRSKFKKKEDFKRKLKDPSDILTKFANTVGTDHGNLHRALKKNFDDETSEMFKDISEEGLLSRVYVNAGVLVTRKRKSHKYTNSPEGLRDLRWELKKKRDIEYNKFDRKVTRGWRLEYRASIGDVSVVDNIFSAQAKIEEKINARYKKYQMTENEQYNEYCGRNYYGMVKNNVACQNWMKGSEQRREAYARTRARDLMTLKRAQKGGDKLKKIYNEYYERQVFEAERMGGDDDLYGDSTGLFDFGVSNSFASDSMRLPTASGGGPIEDYYSFRTQNATSPNIAGFNGPVNYQENVGIFAGQNLYADPRQQQFQQRAPAVVNNGQWNRQQYNNYPMMYGR